MIINNTKMYQILNMPLYSRTLVYTCSYSNVVGRKELFLIVILTYDVSCAKQIIMSIQI